MTVEFILPELGENVQAADIVNVLVAVGDTVEVDQPVLELETDKATVEVPSSVSGVVQAVHVKSGDTVRVGQQILTLAAAPAEGVSPVPEAGDDNGKPAIPAEPTPAPAGPPAEEHSEVSPASPQPSAAPIPVEFKLPAMGENVQAGTVINVLVAVGDTVEVDQPVLELETDKATVEIPSALSGVVTAIHLKPGDIARVDQPVLTIETHQLPQASSTGAPLELPDTSSALPAPPPQPTPTTAPTEVAEVSSFLSPPPALIHIEPGDETTLPSGLVATLEFKVETDPLRSAVAAAPNVRRLAREIGVDITQVPGSGPQGRITMADVKNFARRRGPSAGAAATTGVAAPLPDFSKWGQVKREPMSNIRRKTAEHLAQAWAAIPHVTQFAKADIGEVEELRKRFSKNVEAAGARLTITAIVLKVVTSALKVFPRFNASVDMAKNEVVYKQYYHIGVAVDTEHGLLVPVIRDVDKKNILELAVELQTVAEKARSRKLALEDMQGGNFTITNLGGIGGSYFTPIVNAPEVAILGVARGVMEPVYNPKSGQFEPRLMLPLALSYDHRLIDGADGARFLKTVVEHLEQPFLTALQGW